MEAPPSQGEGAHTARFKFPSRAVGASPVAQTVTESSCKGGGVVLGAGSAAREGRQREKSRLFLQEAHLQSLHLQEPAHVQDSPARRKMQNGPWRTERGHAGWQPEFESQFHNRFIGNLGEPRTRIALSVKRVSWLTQEERRVHGNPFERANSA